MAIKSTEELRHVLLESIEGVKSGKLEPERAQAIAHLAGRVIGSVRLDFDFSRLNGGGRPNTANGSVPLIAHKKT